MVSVSFSTEFQIESAFTIGAYSISDLLRGIQHQSPDFQKRVLELSTSHVFRIIINEEFTCEDIDSLQVLLPYQLNRVEIIAVEVGEGNIGKIALGVGLLVAGLSGVGLLGLSATTVGLFGASLVFSSVFKHPTTKDTKDKPQDKRSVNFSGVVNSTGGGQPLPLVFGEMSIGSIVASAQIVPYETSI